MAYLGTPPRSRVLSSADIDPGSVSLDDISFTDQPASMNISGNIDKHTMRLADQVVVNGDLDITDNLILSKISDDGNAITLTTDGSTRTIEGAGGSLEASTLTQTPNSSLTGMTGAIGSGVSFPTGHVIQTVFVKSNTETPIPSSASKTVPLSTGIEGTITPLYAASTILVQCFVHYLILTSSNANSEAWLAFKVHDGTSFVWQEDEGLSGSNDSYVGVFVFGGSTDPSDQIRGRHPFVFTTPANNTSARTYQIRAWAGTQNYFPDSVKVNDNNSWSQMIIQELAGTV